MAGKAKSCYLTVTAKGSIKTVFHKIFFNANDMNQYVKSEEFLAKYPADQFDYIKETY